jgi:hypothetical protein
MLETPVAASGAPASGDTNAMSSMETGVVVASMRRA